MAMAMTKLSRSAGMYTSPIDYDASSVGEVVVRLVTDAAVLDDGSASPVVEFGLEQSSDDGQTWRHWVSVTRPKGAAAWRDKHGNPPFVSRFTDRSKLRVRPFVRVERRCSVGLDVETK